MRRIPLALICAAAATSTLVAPANAASKSTTSTLCSGWITSTTIDSNLVVAPGTFCGLDGATVTGNVSIGEGATLNAQSSTFDRNLSATAADVVTLWADTILGNTSIDGSTGAVELCVGGDLPAGQLQSVCSGYTSYGSSTGKFGNVSLTNNQSVVVFGGNTVAHDLNCYGNLEGVVNAGVANTVNGTESGQCVGL